MGTASWFRRAVTTGTLVALAAAGVVATSASASADTPEVAITVSPSTAQPGDTVTVTETVTNINGFTILQPTASLFSTPDALPGYTTLTHCDAGAGGTCGTITDGNGHPVGYRAVFGGALGGYSSAVATFTLTLDANDDSAVETLEGQLSGANYGTGVVSGPMLTVNAKADVAVALTGTPQRAGLLGLSLNLDFTVTVTNDGPAALRSATVTATVPMGLRATSTSCTTSGGGAVCSFGAVPVGGKATATFSVPSGLLTIGLPFTFGAKRSASSPTDPNPANDSATSTCTVLGVLAASCVNH